jgi:hypothetical protein
MVSFIDQDQIEEVRRARGNARMARAEDGWGTDNHVGRSEIEPIRIRGNTMNDDSHSGTADITADRAYADQLAHRTEGVRDLVAHHMARCDHCDAS